MAINRSEAEERRIRQSPAYQEAMTESIKWLCKRNEAARAQKTLFDQVANCGKDFHKPPS